MKYFLISFTFFSTLSLGNDFIHLYQGQDVKIKREKKSESQKRRSVFVENFSGEELKSKSNLGSGLQKTLTEKDLEKFKTFSKKELLKERKKDFDKRFEMFLLYHQDTDYEKTGGESFSSIFRNSKSDKPYSLGLSQIFLSPKTEKIKIGVGPGILVARNASRAKFSDDSFTDNLLFLWGIHLDAKLSLSYQGDLFGMGLIGGPSAMTLYQYRTDLETGNDEKSRFQFAPGVFVEGYLSWNLAYKNINRQLFFSKSYDTTHFSLSLVGRIHRYQGFKNDSIRVVGTAVGLGLSVNYY